MNLSYQPHFTNRWVEHGIIPAVRREVKYTAANLQAFVCPWTQHPIQIKPPYKSAQLREKSNITFHFCGRTEQDRTVGRWKEGARGRVPLSGAGVGALGWHSLAIECSGAWRVSGRTCRVRERGQRSEALHHGRLPVCMVPSAHTLLSPLVPISPRLVFHSCPSGCNGVPWVSGWMEVRPLLTAIAGTPFIPLKEP